MVINDYSELIRGDRVRANTPPEINQAIDTEIAASVRFYASKTNYEITKRINELDLEWDIERYLEANAAIFTAIGSSMGLKKQGLVYSATNSLHFPASTCSTGLVPSSVRVPAAWYTYKTGNRGGKIRA